MRRSFAGRLFAVVLIVIMIITAQLAAAEELSVGSKGDSVRKLQAKLGALGYSVGSADGDYGKKTAAAVEAFQADNGLEPTGIADDRTQVMIYSKPTAEAAYKLAEKSKTDYVKKNGRMIKCTASYDKDDDFRMSYEVFDSNGYGNTSYTTTISLWFNDTSDINEIDPSLRLKIYVLYGQEPTLVMLTINGEEAKELPKSMWSWNTGDLNINFSDNIDLYKKLMEKGGGLAWSNIYPSSLSGIDISKNTMEYKAMKEVWDVFVKAGLEPIADGTVAALSADLETNTEPEVISNETEETPEETAEEGTADEETAWPADVQVGDTITFGSYPQGANGEVAPIEWTVLDIDEEGYYVLISNYGLDVKEYNEEQVDITWEKCSLRSWLNGEFLETAFSENEQNKIGMTHNENEDNPEYGTLGGNETDDRIYLLSNDDIVRYYGIAYDKLGYTFHDELCCKPTEYAKAKGAFVFTKDNDSYKEKYEQYLGNGTWWLRSPSLEQDWANRVSYFGIADAGWYVNENELTIVRPVINVKTEAVPDTVSNELEGTQEETTAERPADVQIGDSVTFGSYPQGANGEVAPIEWTVLDIDEEGCYVLISNYGIDVRKYDDDGRNVSWENCTLRTWLNDDFINAAFGDEERTKIIDTYLDNSGHGADDDNNTEDKVYILSLDEITQYYGISQEQFTESHEDLCCKPTECAIANGAFYNNENGNCDWWLRSRGEEFFCRSMISTVGYVSYDAILNFDFICVRPVIRIQP